MRSHHYIQLHQCVDTVHLAIGPSPPRGYISRYFPLHANSLLHSTPTSIFIPTIQLPLHSSTLSPLLSTSSPTLLPTYPTDILPQVVTLSTPRSVTYYYYPKRVNAIDALNPNYQYLTVTRAPKRTQAELLTPPNTPPLSYSRTTTPNITSPSTPIPKMARGTARNVEFAKEVVSCRAPREDELSVMTYFAKHASRCEHCRDPYDAWRSERPLCSRGMSLARDVSNYLYAKGGKPFSIIDRRNDDRVQVQIPLGCEAVSLLIKAFDKGMKTTATKVVVDNSRRLEPARVISPVSPSSPSRRREYITDDRPRRERQYIDDKEYEFVEIKPHSSRNDRRERTTYRGEKYERRERPKYEGKGSLFPQDVEEKSRRQQFDRQPVVIVAEPGQQRYVIRRDR